MTTLPLCSAAHTAFLIDVDRGIRPCCSYEGRHRPDTNSVALLGEQPLAEVLASEAWTAVRDQLGRGRVPPGCVDCIKRERMSGWSQRVVMEQRRSPNWERGITYIELSSSNVCNLQCRHCNGKFSSRWSAHDRRHGKQKWPIVMPDADLLRANLRSVDLSHVEYVVVKGGEPMLNTDFHVLIDHLESLGVFDRVIVDMVTNGTYHDDELLRRLARCKELRVCLSIDGTDDVQTYIRHGSSSLPRIERAIAAYAAMPNVRMTRNTSVMIYNVFCLDRIDAWWDDLARRFPGRYLRPNYGLFVLWPEALSVSNLQDHTRAMLRAKYTALDAARYAPVVKWLEAPFAGVKRHDDFIRFTEAMDRELGRSVLDAVPELREEMQLLAPVPAEAVVADAGKPATGTRPPAAEAKDFAAALAAGWAALGRGELDSTAALLANLDGETDAEEAALLHLDATLAAHRGDIQTAFQRIDSACGRQPDHLGLRLDRGRALEALGRFDEALVDAAIARADLGLRAQADALLDRCRNR